MRFGIWDLLASVLALPSSIVSPELKGESNFCNSLFSLEVKRERR